MLLNHFPSSILLLGLGYLLSQLTLAEPLEEIVITAPRQETSTFAAPYTVRVLNPSALRETLPRTLPEALEGTPGVLVQKTSNGQGSPYLRGFTGYRALTLIDGVRYNHSVYRDGPNEYFSLIDSYSIDQLELLSGPASTLYGSDAIGGTLNLKTRAAEFSTVNDGQWFVRGSQRLRVSSGENSQLLRTELELGRGQSWGLKLGYSKKDFGDITTAQLGRQDDTGYQSHAIDGRFDLLINEHWSFTAARQKLNKDNVSRTHSTVAAISFAGTSIGSDLKREKDHQRSLNYLRFSGVDLNRFVDTATVTLSYQTTEENGIRIRSDNRIQDDFFNSKLAGIDLQFTSTNKFGRLIYGFDFYRDKVDSGRQDFNGDGELLRTRIQGPVGDDTEFDLLGLYVQSEHQLTKRLLLDLGIRYTDTRAQIGRFEDPVTGDPAAFDDRWRDQVFSLRGNYSLSSDWKIWAGISQSFRAPNIADLSRFGKSRSNEIEIAATELEPETFITYETGIKQQNPRSQFDASIYYTRIENFITSTPTGRIRDGLIEVSKQNSARGFVRGLELSGRFNLDDQWQVRGNLSWQRGELETFATTNAMSAESEPLSRVAPPSVLVALRWEDSVLNKQPFWSELQVLAVQKADRLSQGDRNDTERIPPGGTPAYTLVNLYGGIEWNNNMTFNLGLRNIFDEAYRHHGSGTNEPGRSFNFGLEVQF